jgi:protein-disulfide isomerase
MKIFHRSSVVIRAGILTLGLLTASAGCSAGPGTHADDGPATRDDAKPVDYRTLGSADAPVTIVEFTDLQCPYCARFASDTFPELRARYIDTGKVRFTTRDLPLPMHAYAVTAAVAAGCAGEQGRYWEYREMLFRGQARLAQAPYESIARHFGLDVERFAACRTDGKMEARVRDDRAVAHANGIASTPTIVIGRMIQGEFRGDTISGAQPIEVYAQRIEALLAELP